MKSKMYQNKCVQITTRQGITYRGKIVRVSSDKVYLQMDQPRDPNKKVHISWFPFIIPLVLFDLLAIVLISERRRCCF
ncbi:hypothetical protein [Paenibacillus guangzhouensis]|uniref:hypothetical protein n=1 Tax=Paenibacillus guangzhouensis TaxID=1473112 RepID=UPI0012676593|nr:hypothetical protein [Paenibacillus guangzhouensis]